MFTSQLLKRYLANGSDQAAFTLASGVTAAAPWAASALHAPINISAAKGLLLWFFGTGSADIAIPYRVWALDEHEGYPSPTYVGPPIGYTKHCMGAGTFTLGTGTGAGTSGSVIKASEKVADQVTFSLSHESNTNPAGPGEKLTAILGEGVPDVYSPAANLQAALLLPSVWRKQVIVVEFAIPANITSANVAYQLVNR